MGEQIFGASRATTVADEGSLLFHLEPPSTSLVDMGSQAMTSKIQGRTYAASEGIEAGLVDGSAEGDEEEGRRRHNLSLVSTGGRAR